MKKILFIIFLSLLLIGCTNNETIKIKNITSFNEFKNVFRKFFRLKPLVETFDDTYADKFKQKQLLIMYNNRYPIRSVFIRMPVDETTTVEDVEAYFDEILWYLKEQ